ncbi:8976_t:CDS:2, partial [Funneliformis caledonium]
ADSCDRRVLVRETAKRNIHVIVEPPMSTATSSREQELLDRIASLEESLNKSVHELDVVSRRLSIGQRILDTRRSKASKIERCFISRYITTVRILKFSVFTETPSKAFSE